MKSNLSKSKLMAFRQCPKRLWLEVKKPNLIEITDSAQASFNVGHKVGEIARKIYDKNNDGIMIDISKEGFSQALTRSKSLINANTPIFEAGFSSNGVLAFADILLPEEESGQRVWHMVEVKSSTSVKDYHLDDIAVQSYAAESAGFKLKKVSLAHIDNSFIYSGDGDYSGILAEKDLTDKALSRNQEVKAWINQAHTILNGNVPNIEPGDQCKEPFECGFYKYCTKDKVQVEFPVEWLPRISSKKVKQLAEKGIFDLREVPDDLLNDTQLKVKKQSVINQPYFDQKAAQAELSGFIFPAYFLDFETINFPVPIWKDTRPYQAVPFQFSLHVMHDSGELIHHEFLDTSGNSPVQGFAEMLVETCGDKGPVFVYNAAFETSRIKELAAMLPYLSTQLLSINERIVDLLPIARNYVYFPSQQGSWSIKHVLPALVPTLKYSDLEGVQHGGMAMDAFVEALQSTTTSERKEQIRSQLLAYCKLDTYAMVRLWGVFLNRDI
jgi:hypothetical protein